MAIVVEANEGKADPVQREYAKKGPRVAIISGIVDLGIQPQEYLGEVKRPRREFLPILTLCGDKYTDEDGVAHNMITSPWPIKITLGDKANYTKFCNAADPNGNVMKEGVGDITGLIGCTVFAVMVHTEKDGITYANCKGIQELPDEYPIPKTDYNRVVFDCTNPDPAVWEGLWDRTKEKIMEGVDFNEKKFNELMSNYVSEESKLDEEFLDAPF